MKKFDLATVLSAFVLAFASTLALAQEPGSSSIQPVYTPGLGEIMGSIQIRHAKLWFAGQGKNWQLAAYELDELREGIEATAKYRPEFKGNPIAKMIGPITAGPFAQLEQAIEAKDSVRFFGAYDELSNACTVCHQDTGFDFIVIQRPDFPPLTNQRYDIKGRH